MAGNSALEHEIIIQKKENDRRRREGKPVKAYNLVKNYQDKNTGAPKGKPTGICKSCGETFEQVFSEDRNSYSSYRICPKCRNKKRIEQEKKIGYQEQEVAVATLPYTPYPWQVEAEEAFNKHRFIVLACGNRCVLPGTFINGCDKLSEDITENDFVFGKNGCLQPILSLNKEQYAGEIYTIKALGLEPIKCNKEHPILIAKGVKKNRDARINIIEEKFICAEDLENISLGKYERLYVKMIRAKGDLNCNYWGFERFKKNRKNQLNGIPINEDTAWMLGVYCAEGCFIYGSGCKFTLNYAQHNLSDRLCSILDSLEIHYNVRERPNEGTRCVIVSKMQFCRKLDDEIGHGSINKKIPADILYNKNEKILISFMKGYYDGDGHLNNQDVILQATTVSRILAQQIQTAWTRIGHFSKINFQQRNRKKKDGSFCNAEYSITVTDAEGIKKLGYEVRNKKEYQTAIVTADAIYTKLDSIKKEYGETELIVISTYDETFLANNLQNHNSGKDRFTIMCAIKYFVACLNENRIVKNPDLVPPVLWWQIAPTEKMAKQNWRELKQYFPKEWVVSCSDSNYQMETVGGGVIEVRSGYSPDDLVGVGLDLVTITEGARFKDLHLAWANLSARLDSPGRGLGGKGGKAIINSSPIGKNDFYDLFCFGQKTNPNYSSYWWSAQYPWTCNPENAKRADELIDSKYGKIRYEDMLRRQIGDRTFRSNYLADFLAEDGSVFKNFEDNCVISIHDEQTTGCKTKKEKAEFIQNWKRPIPSELYIAGYDPATGSSQDSPCLVIRHVATGRVVRAFDLYGKNYTQQYDFIAEICKMYNYADINWLRTGHTAIEGEFEKRNIREVPIDENGHKKGALVQTLELAVENGDVHVLRDGSAEIDTLISQMNDYTEKQGKYSNNKVEHDDFVSAMYAAFSDYNVADTPMAYCSIMGSL